MKQDIYNLLIKRVAIEYMDALKNQTIILTKNMQQRIYNNIFDKNVKEMKEIILTF